jgi:cell division control protein 6
MYQVYQLLCSALDINILTQRWVTDLINELDQLGIIDSTLEYNGRYGRNRRISSVSSKEHALEKILEDFRMQSISNIPFKEFIPKFKK